MCACPGKILEYEEMLKCEAGDQSISIKMVVASSKLRTTWCETALHPTQCVNVVPTILMRNREAIGWLS